MQIEVVLQPSATAGTSTGVTSPRDAAFSAFYTASRPRLLRVLVAITADLGEAEDALQEAYVKSAQRWSSLTDPESWVRHVAVNHVRDSQRRTASRKRALDRLHSPATVTEPGGETIDAVNLLRLLPLEQREALALHYLLDLTVDQVAAELGRPAGTVKAQLSRGRERLRRFVEHPEVAHD